MDIGKRIRDLREGRGLTQREVARRAGLTPSGVGFIEHGQTRNPSAETVMAVARALGVPVEELLREPVPLADAPEAGQAEAEAEEERRVIPKSAADLKSYIKNMKELKEFREAEMEDLGKGVDLPPGLLVQMALADKGLRDSLKVEGFLDFAEAVRAGRAMAQPEAIPLCHELLRRLDELERLSAEARAASGVAGANIWVGGIKTASGAESFLAEQTAPEGS